MAQKGWTDAARKLNGESESDRIENADTLSGELKEQLQIIRESKTFLLFFLAALILSYFTISIQEDQLICAAASRDCGPPRDTCPMRITANILSLLGLIYFYDLARETAFRPAAGERQRRRNRINHIASLLTLIAGILRLIITLDECSSVNNRRCRLQDSSRPAGSTD